MYKDKEVKNVNNFLVNVWRKNIFDIYVTEYGTALTSILPILFLYLTHLRFMLRRSSLVECVSVLPGNRCLQNVEFFFFDNMFSRVC
jgi:hypothetical protein